MIPEIEFDTESFQEIFEEARGKIAGLYPEWTDYNYHDPGITMLELFAWLKEGQQFYMDQTGEEQKEKFLKLLGTCRKKKEAAKAILTLDVEKDTIIPRGTKFYADAICYESTDSNYMIKEDIETCFYADTGMKELLDKKQLDFGHRLQFRMFGDSPEAGAMFYIGLQDALPQQIEVSIYFEFYTGYEVKRNHLDRQLTVPFVHFSMEYFTKDSWMEVSNLRDDTYGFLQNGQLYFTLKEKMVQASEYGEEGYFLRIRLLDGGYDIAPVMEKIAVNAIQAEQQDQIIEHEEVKLSGEEKEGKLVIRGTTYLNLYGSNDIYIEKDSYLYDVKVVQKYLDEDRGSCSFSFELPEKLAGASKIHIISFSGQSRDLQILGIGNGYPNQRYTLSDDTAVYETFQLMVQEEEKEEYAIWKLVDDFAGSSPEDRHFTFDSRDGTVRFGNGRHGLAPAGEIRIIGYARSLGKEGKVKKNQIEKTVDELNSNIVVTNQQDSYGGRQEESLEESFIRIRKEMFHPETAVTYEDYERYIRQTPGLMIASCMVLLPKQVKELFPYYDDSAVTVVVKPYAGQLGKKLMETYQDNILTYLEQYRMAGTGIYLIQPEYIQFELIVEVVIKAHYLHGEEEVKGAVEDFFDQLSDEFGGCVRYSRLYGTLDTLSCVKRMQALSFEVRGTGMKYLPDGSVQLPANGVVELKHTAYQFIRE